jgi:hypothetical protein
VAKGLAQVCDKPCYSGSSVVSILVVKRNGEQFKNRDQKFNGKSFELWKLKMEDILVDKDQWVIVDPGTAPTECQQKTGQSWIRRKRAQSGCVSQIQYY